jgi:hypothetical protein
VPQDGWALLWIDIPRPGLPLDLRPFGAPQCDLHVALLGIWFPVPGRNRAADFSFVVPNAPGVQAWAQWAVGPHTSNALGASTSERSVMVLGQ